jgi:serine/threonine-protein kinase
MADVWRAHDTRLGRDVAIKLLSGPSARKPAMRKRIEREARALAALSHHNIVGVYDYGEGEGPSGDVQPYIAMELVAGDDLQHHIDRDGPLAVDEATAILRAVLAAMERAHTAGIVHGDLKPANIILGPSGPKVGDFGVARILAEETGTTTLAATPSFAPPEVLRGERPARTSDLYSAGCVTFQMLTGRPPYEGANAWEVSTKHLEAPVPALRDVRADVPIELSNAIARAMEKNPKRRFPSAQAFAEAVAATPATVPVSSPAAGAVPGSPSTEVLGDRPDLAAAVFLGPLAEWGERIRDRLQRVWPRVRRSPRALLVGLVALLALVAALLFTGGGSEQVTVPDVRGLESRAAAAQLRMDGFRTDVSYRPVTSGTPDLVLETVPAGGARIEPGTRIHIIASALARTPTPEPEPDPVPNEGGDGGGGNGDRGRGKDKEDD